jgi:hypothetical protein
MSTRRCTRTSAVGLLNASTRSLPSCPRRPVGPDSRSSSVDDGGQCAHADAERELPGLLGGNVLRPRAHQGCRTRIASIAFEGIAFQHPSTTADADRFLRQHHDGALHGNVCGTGTLHRRQRGIDVRLGDRSVIQRPCRFQREEHLGHRIALGRDFGL